MTTIFARQGHYTHDAKSLASHPAADLTVERIGDLVACGLPSAAGRSAARRLQQE